MDNKKIGKLIADLRKAKGLTQQDLGDMVGVGFRAVSKWERGITMPDISIINELSKILGITSDELLSGEVNKDIKSSKNNKVSNKIKITISIITAIILIITATTIYLQNKTYVYGIKKTDGSDYYIEGQIIFKKDEMKITINKLKFTNEKFSSTTIKNYDYEIYSNNYYIFGYGKNLNNENIEEEETIEQSMKKLRINYNGEIIINKKQMIKNKIILKFNFLDQNDNIITKEIIGVIY